MTRAVFLDRDGVLIKTDIRDGKPYAMQRPEDMELLAGAVEAVARLHRAGFVNIVVTNQPDVARGAIDRQTVEDMHKKLSARLAIDDIRVCYHDNRDGCDCRKPKPGMLLKAADELNIDLKSSFLVGDRWRDIGAGIAAGCTTLWIDRGYDERRGDDADHTVASISDAVSIILSAVSPGD